MAVSAHGTLLQIGDGEDYDTIAEVLDITGPAIAFTADVYRGDGDVSITLPGVSETSEVTFELNYTGVETQAYLRQASLQRAETSFRILFPTNPVEAVPFRGYVTRFERVAPVAGVLRASVTITLSRPLT